LAASAVRAVNQKGELVVDMPEIKGCGKDHIETDIGVGMVDGKLLLPQFAKGRYLRMFHFWLGLFQP